VEHAGAHVGSISWPGGEALARYLLARPALVAARGVVELGCGLGVAGLAARAAGAAWVVLTDRAALVPLAAASASANAAALGGGVAARELEWAPAAWRAAALEPAVLLAADAVYTPEGARALAALLDAALAPAGCAACCLMAYKPRGAGAEFGGALAAAGVGARALATDGEHVIVEITRGGACDARGVFRD
jgi:predicted nicotinamide N-methyase